MDDKEVFNPQSGERIAPKKPKKFWKDWRFYVYTIIALMLGIVSVSSMVTACAAINAGVGQSEPVTSQYKVKLNEKSTTPNGGYDKYTFSVPSYYSSESENWVCAKLYDVDTSTYTLHWSSTERTTIENGFSYIYQYIQGRLEAYIPSTNTYQFLLIEGHSGTGIGDYTNWAYFSFLCRDNFQNRPMSFVLTNVDFQATAGLKDYSQLTARVIEEPIVLNYETSNYLCLFNSAEAHSNVGLYSFQDVKSYYKELGYQAGHTAGYAEGYDAGETHAYETLQTGIAFETYGMYADAKITLVADRTEGSYYYMDLFDYVTDTNTERSVYVLYIRNASNSTWLGYVQDVNASDSSGATYDIGSFTGASSTTNVVFTALMDRNLWEGAYITSFHGHAEAVNNAFWFTGGSYAATQQIYQDGYGEGYDVGRNDGYDLGYDAGVQVGRTQGMNEVEPESLTNTLVAVFQQPFNQLYRFFNFNVLGLNVLGIVSGLVSVLVVLKVFKKLYK